MSDQANLQPDVALAQAWQQVLRRADSTSRAWLRSSHPMTVHESIVLIAVPSEYARGRIETHQRSEIEQALSDAFNRSMHLAVTVQPDLELDLGVPEEPVAAEATPTELVRRTDAPTSPVRPVLVPGGRADVQTHAQATVDRADGDRLNPKYTFDNFVIGESNRFAHAAAVAVAEAPGKAYNPLFIYGDSGLGKTHLLHAIGHYVQSLYPALQVKYVSHRGVHERLHQLDRGQPADRLPARYREVDMLLIDDIQFLERRCRRRRSSSTPSTRCTTPSKQIVITSDRPPKRTRGARGAAAQPLRVGPDHRCAAARPGDAHRHPAQDGAERLLTCRPTCWSSSPRIQTNIRELEGALIRVTAFANLNGTTST